METISTFTSHDARSCGLDIYAGNVGEDRVLYRGTSDIRGCHKLFELCPNYRLFDFTRPERLGEIEPSTESTSKVQPTRKHGLVSLDRTSLSQTRNRDWSIFRVVIDGYDFGSKPWGLV